MRTKWTLTAIEGAPLLLLVPLCVFGYFGARSALYTDDIFFGRQSILFRTIGITRFTSMGGCIWVEFQPEMARTSPFYGDRTNWSAYPARGKYGVGTSPNAGFLERLGFGANTADGIFYFPYWFPVFGSIFLLFTEARLKRRQLSFRASLAALLLASSILGALVYVTHVYAWTVTPPPDIPVRRDAPN